MSADVQNYVIGSYEDFSECQAAATQRVNHSLDRTGVLGDYECGLNCEIKEKYGGLYMCEETRK